MQKGNNSIAAAIALAGSGKRYPVMKLANDDPELAAVISKMVSPAMTPQFGTDGNRKPETPNLFEFMGQARQITNNITDARASMQLLPDMELSAQILISSVLSPKDMTTTELTYVAPEDLMDAELAASLTNRIRQFFEQDYKIKPLLPKILRDMLFETGSYPVAVIPENSLDELINSDSRITMESLSEHFATDGTVKPLGVLGDAVKPKTSRAKPGLSLESIRDYQFDTGVNTTMALEGLDEANYITVIDNPAVLKIPDINDKVRNARVAAALGIPALESDFNAISTNAAKLNDRQISHLIYKTRDYGYNPVAILKTPDQLRRRTVGNALVKHFMSDSVLTAHIPGSPEKIIGVFVLIDADGYPLSGVMHRDEYQQMSQRLTGAGGGGFASSMLAKVQNGMDGFTQIGQTPLDQSKRMFAGMVEADLLARLRNGIYTNGAALSSNSELYTIMMARTLAKQHTQLLFIPAALFTYFAFRFDENGIGESLMDGMKILNSLRAMLMFADVMAAVRNSIGRTEVAIKFDEDDPDPFKSAEIMKHQIINSRKQAFPLGANSPTDLVDYLAKAGYEFTYEGHPDVPDVKVDFSEKNTNYTKPDQELSEYLRKAAIMSVGLTPENVDAGFQAEFATTIMTNNLLLAKRVMNIQEDFIPQVTDHLRKVAINSGGLCQDLIQIISDNFDKVDVEEMFDGKPTELQIQQTKQAICNKVLRTFLTNFEVTLPSPNSITLDNQLDAMKTYSDALDEGLEYWISSSFFTTDQVGEVAGQTDTVKAIVKAQLMRNWMSENGVLPELSALTELAEDGTPSINFGEGHDTHIAALTKAMGELLIRLLPIKGASDKLIQSTGEELDGGAGGGGGNNENENESGNAGGGDDDFEFEEEEDPFAAQGGGEEGGGDATKDNATANAEPEKPEEEPAAE